VEPTGSKTALMTAAYRARASARPAPERLCDDPWAGRLAGEEGAALARRFDQGFAHLELWIAVRTAYLDAQVRQHIASGGRQVVLLGAGLDTRGARLREDGVRFFEVDHPKTQAEKRRRLDALSDYPVTAATYVPCDFEHQDFVDCLREAAFAPHERALLIWEGVVYYLTEPAIRQTLRRVASGCEPRSRLVFDYSDVMHSKEHQEGDTKARIREEVAQVGEPMRFGTRDVTPILADEGFRHVRTVSFDQACLSLTGTYDRERQFRFQSFAIASRAAPFEV
jgi:methyltransferase (TIGR00027 family)